ncbi:YkvA family protein [Dokdonella sp.]|uniref:YkvA family protein n=1 Tax=Dokdonella sp. TaxID=2291710 RepID=UPI003528A4A6
MRITFELESEDIEYFQKAFERFRRMANEVDEVHIIDAAKHTLDNLCIARIPNYVRKRLVHVQRLILLLEDADWSLSAPERTEALAALAYFGDPDDLIPDHIEIIGLIDDAIMLELLARRMRHVLQAYGKFCAFRESLGDRSGQEHARVGRARALASRRAELMDELQSRRERVDSRIHEAD